MPESLEQLKNALADALEQSAIREVEHDESRRAAEKAETQLRDARSQADLARENLSEYYKRKNNARYDAQQRAYEDHRRESQRVAGGEASISGSIL